MHKNSIKGVESPIDQRGENGKLESMLKIWFLSDELRPNLANELTTSLVLQWT